MARDRKAWCGLRPTTPGNVPLIGRSGIGHLLLNTGHGSLGRTLACGSAAALADILEGRPPAVDFPFLAGGRAARRVAPSRTAVRSG